MLLGDEVSRATARGALLLREDIYSWMKRRKAANPERCACSAVQTMVTVDGVYDWGILQNEQGRTIKTVLLILKYVLLMCTTILKRSISSEIFSEVSVCRVPVDYCGTVSLYRFVPHALRRKYRG